VKAPAAVDGDKPVAKQAEVKLPTLKAEPRRIELPDPPRPLPPSRPQVVATPSGATKSALAKKPDAAAGHFTLQLSAFPDKGDAEEFMHKMQAAGYKPYMVSSEIPGKGVFFRVRIGDYGTRQSALDAKTDFERKQRLIAYVAKL
jgi:cell division septation protein DedD